MVVGGVTAGCANFRRKGRWNLTLIYVVFFLLPKASNGWLCHAWTRAHSWCGTQLIWRAAKTHIFILLSHQRDKWNAPKSQEYALQIQVISSFSWLKRSETIHYMQKLETHTAIIHTCILRTISHNHLQSHIIMRTDDIHAKALVDI